MSSRDVMSSLHMHISDVVVVICNCNQLQLITFEK